MNNVRSELDGIVYLTDCTLATVSSMAMKKSRPKGEYSRQIEIAQKGYQMMVDFGFDFDATPRFGVVHAGRAREIWKDFNGSVVDWSKKYEEG